MEEKKTNKLLVPFIFAILVILGLCAFIAYDKLVVQSIEKQEGKKVPSVEDKTSTDKEEETTKTEVKEPYRICVGIYKGDGPVSKDIQTQATTNGEYNLELKEDGTYEYKAGLTKNEGNFVVMKNTLVLLSFKEITGPKDQDPSVNASTNVISEDCSKVTLDEWSEKVILNKQ